MNKSQKMSGSPSNFITPMLTDFYQVSMCYGYWKNGRHNDYAVFDTFFRKCPFKGEYCVFAGVSEILHFLETFRFTPSDVDYIRQLIPSGEPEFFEWLLTLDASELKVYSLVDGTVAFPRTNVLRVEGPLALAQLCETTLLVLTNYSSLVATNAARFRKAAGTDALLLEFGLRRAQGPDGAMTASKYSYIGGFDGTSNTLAGKNLGIPCSGTHAHAYVSSFASEEDLKVRNLGEFNILDMAKAHREANGFNTNDSELVAFVSYAIAFPNGFLALVDTYDTLSSGVPNFLCVAHALHTAGFKPVGIRLDSGDLAYISKCTRKMFESYSERWGLEFQKLRIVASNDINEEVLHSLNTQGHSIDAYGIGTNLVTCQSQPALGMVYKLVQINGIPRIKLSNDKEKITIPGRKTIYRLLGENGIAIGDLLLNSDCPAPVSGERILARHPFDESKRMYAIPTSVECLHQLIWDGTKRYEPPHPKESREYLKSQLELIRPDITRSLNPTPYKISVSSDLYDYIHETWERELPIKEIK